jgi:hypothetical protein
MASIISPYAKGTAPGIAARWEKHVEDAPSVEAAQLQLAYDSLLQLRAIKLLLIWVMVIVPLVAVVALLVLSGMLEPEPAF